MDLELGYFVWALAAAAVSFDVYMSFFYGRKRT